VEAFMKIRFWGTRGSIPSPGPRTVRYGGNCSCVEIRTRSGDLFIIDAGTGIRELGISLMAKQPVSAHILLSHTHWDHISGFPFFPPAFAPGNTLTVYAARNIDKRLEDVMAGQMEYTYFPVTLNDLPAEINYRELLEETITIGSARITTHYLNHTSICMGYRVEADGKSVVYVSDHEPYGLALFGSDPPVDRIGRGLRDGVVHVGDRRLIEWISGADLVIQDTQYTPDEYPKKSVGVTAALTTSPTSRYWPAPTASRCSTTIRFTTTTWSTKLCPSVAIGWRRPVPNLTFSRQPKDRV